MIQNQTGQQGADAVAPGSGEKDGEGSRADSAAGEHHPGASGIHLFNAIHLGICFRNRAVTCRNPAGQCIQLFHA